MKILFQKIFALVLSILFLATIFILYFRYTNEAVIDAKKALDQDIEYVQEQVKISETSISKLETYAQNDVLLKAKSLTFMLKSDPALLHNTDFLNESLKFLELEEINIVDSNGIIISSVPDASNIGYNYADNENTKGYLQLIGNKDTSLTEVPRSNVLKDPNDVRVYAGASRSDDNGFIQVGGSFSLYNNTLNIVSIDEIAANYKIGDNGFLFIVRNGMITSSGNQNYVNCNMNSIGISDEQINNDTGYFEFNNDNVDYYCEYKKMSDYTVFVSYPKSEMFKNRNVLLVWSTVFFLVLFILLFYLTTIILEKFIIKGINNMNHSLSEITKGDFQKRVNVYTSPEFTQLSHGINETVSALEKAILEASSKIDKELEFAKAIQNSFIPTKFPAFPKRNEIDVYASMDPAKEVGGDFYDFFFIDKDKLFIMIADVSGKGIPAALFMMRAKASIVSYIQSGMSLSHTAISTNNELTKDNKMGMFVTMFMGILNVETGVFKYVNAGHNPPLVRKNGAYEWINKRSGLILGSIRNMKYVEHEMNLSNGDMLYLYTDGVTEAFNEHNQLYSSSRLEDTLSKITDLDCKETIDYMKKDLEVFSKNCDQADDISMLTVSYNVSEINVTSDEKYLDYLTAKTNQIFEKYKISENLYNKLNLITEEVFINISKYAYIGNSGKVTLKVAFGGSPKYLTLKFIDEGVPFNPLQVEPIPNKIKSAKDIDEEKLGISLIRQLSDNVTYDYVDNKNILTIYKNI